MYLHLRCKDSVVAGGLYTKAGFTAYQRDWPILLLIGQEPRFLMRKQLQAPRPLAGRVLLPQQQQQQQDVEQQPEPKREAVQAVPAAQASPAA